MPSRSRRSSPAAVASGETSRRWHMKMKALMIWTLAALLTGASAFAGGGAVVASASGGYGFTGTAVGSFFDVQPFTWSVQLHADGSVHGRFDYTQVRDGVELSA